MSTISYRNKNAGQRDKNGKRKKPNWEYRFELAPIGGKRRRMEKSGFPRKQDAVEAATAAYAEYMSAGTVIQPSKMSYADVLDRWMEEYGMQELADETIRNYNTRIRNYIKPALGSYTVTSLDTYAIQRFINQMVKDRYSRNTIVGCKGIISKSLKYAKRMRWVARNEALEVELPSWNASRKLRCKIRMPLRREQIKEIFERFPEGTPCYIPFLFGYRAGTRLGETFALCWNDIDFENNQIDINKQVQWYPERKQWRMVPPKYDSRREIDMDRETMACLRRERQRQREARLSRGKTYDKYYVDAEGYINTEGIGKEFHRVMVREDGSYIQTRIMQHYSSIIHQELGNKAFDFHTLRHTHATELEEAGVAIKEIQRRLGHKSEMTTRRVYVHHTDEMREQSIEIINTMFK